MESIYFIIIFLYIINARDAFTVWNIFHFTPESSISFFTWPAKYFWTWRPLISLSFRSLTAVENNLECIKEVNQKPKRGYKHVPHREKSVQVVEKRNARERKRVQEVNQAFLRLQKALPTLNKVMEWYSLIKKQNKFLVKIMKILF